MSERGDEAFDIEQLSPEGLGARYMTTRELAALAERLRQVATWVEELRLLRLERERETLERVGHRPTIGYYLRLRAEAAANHSDGAVASHEGSPTVSSPSSTCSSSQDRKPA